MKDIKNVVSNLFGDQDYQVLESYICESCKQEVKTVRAKILGGSRKGEYQTIKNECHCRLADETIQAEKRSKINHFKQYWTVNDSLKHATLENYQPRHKTQQQALAKAYEFLNVLESAEQPARMIYWGEPGMGKSHLGLSICRTAEKELGLSTMFIELPTLKDVLKASFNNQADYNQHEIMEALALVDLLVLDDLGAEGITEWTAELVFTILNKRMKKNMLVTTNMKVTDIYQEYGAKHFDRLIAGVSKDNVVKLEGSKSYRLREWLEEDWT